MVKCREFWPAKMVNFIILQMLKISPHIWVYFRAERRRFYHKIMPHDTGGKNRYKAENNGKFHLFSSGWKNGENHLFPSRWKFGPYQQKNGGGIVVIPPPRALCRAYAVSCRETKNPNPLPTANRFGFFDFGTPDWIRTGGLQSRSLTLYPTELRAHIVDQIIITNTG